MQWFAMFQNELLKNWRNRKFIWVPLVMMMLAVMDMLTYYFLPEILKLSGDTSEGMILDMPALSQFDAIELTLAAFSNYGVLILVLISMGMISSDRKNGIAEIILTKPINLFQYLTAKWAVFIVISLSSLLLGLVLAWYYVNILFSSLDIILLMQVFLFYSVWYIFIISLVLFYNSFLINSLGIAAMTIATLAVMSFINSAFGHVLTWFPNNLSQHIMSLIISNDLSRELWATSCLTLLLAVSLILVAHFIFSRVEILK